MKNLHERLVGCRLHLGIRRRKLTLVWVVQWSKDIGFIVLNTLSTGHVIEADEVASLVAFLASPVLPKGEREQITHVLLRERLPQAYRQTRSD